MIITLKKLEKLKPCSYGLVWAKDNFPSGKADLLEALLKCNEVNPSYARWLFTNLMNRKQCIKIAIYAAKQVLHIFESKYPNDKRPREAIEAAKKCLEHNTKANREAANNAYAAADDTVDFAARAAVDFAAYAAYAANAAARAVDAVDAADDAAMAVLAASIAANYAANANELQKKIIKKAVQILEGK